MNRFKYTNQGIISSKVYCDQIQTTIEPNTKTLIPNTVLERFHLVGLGARKVTFLNITAYTISFYLPKRFNDIYDECCLQIIPYRYSMIKKGYGWSAYEEWIPSITKQAAGKT